MAGFTVGNTNIFTSNTFSGTFNGFTSTNQLVFEDTGSHFQGETNGFLAGGGGVYPASPSPRSLVIDKFPFAVDTNATNVGSLSAVTGDVSGQSSETNGYASGGSQPALTNKIEKYPFAISSGTATDIADLSEALEQTSGASSTTHGYVMGGNPSSPGRTNTIQKFPFAVDSNATDVGDLSVSLGQGAGFTSSTNGFNVGGANPPSDFSTIDSFPFANDNNATAVGNLPEVTRTVGAASSVTSGYSSGGNPPAPGVFVSTINKFNFTGNYDSAGIGDLSRSKRSATGQSSTTDGYITAGYDGIPPGTNVRITDIDKFPFATDTNATNIGDVSQAREAGAGSQV